MLAVAEGRLDQIELKWDPRPALCVVASSKGYPGSYSTGVPITGLDDADSMNDVKVFHSGTKKYGAQLQTDGGRVLGVTALGESIQQAQQRAYEALKKIHFDGMHYRTDIAHQAIKLAR
jgi:phosphoribosylamine--glycine ligase